MQNPTYSIIIPVYNEESTLIELSRRLINVINTLDGPAEVILVDDGSCDGSYNIMSEIHENDSRFKIVQLSRNFGHQIAITTGIDLSSGDAVIIMDADLQDPPEVLHEMCANWRKGYDIVYAAREERIGESWFKKKTAELFYRIFRKLSDIDTPLNVGDFRLIDRKVVRVFRTVREKNRYVRGIFCWLGFKSTAVKYKRDKRFSGFTKYPLRKMIKFALDGIISFSNIPLRCVLYLGLAFSALAFLYALYLIITKSLGFQTVTGWASIVLLILTLGGIQLVVIGIIGEYIARMYDEIKDRPLYILQHLEGFSPEALKYLQGSLYPVILPSEEYRNTESCARCPEINEERRSLPVQSSPAPAAPEKQDHLDGENRIQ